MRPWKFQHWKHLWKTETTHTQNITHRFYIYKFFHHNDTVVDAQISKIFERQQSIRYVFLNRHPLICSSPAWILLCKFWKNIPNTQKWLSFWGEDPQTLIITLLLFFQLNHASWIGNLIKRLKLFDLTLYDLFSFLLPYLLKPFVKGKFLWCILNRMFILLFQRYWKTCN